MSPKTSDREGAGTSGALWLRVLSLCLAVVLCYANSLQGPFLLDDPYQANVGVQPPPTRPLVWATFDLNHALSGREPWSFHVFNALVHLACGLLLFGVLRRAMAHAAPRLSERTRTDLAFVTSLLWLCHPLQTAAVTYVSQRAESMTALFTLALLYAFQRWIANRGAWSWATLVFLALGFATKEIFAIAPLLVFLYDALFLSAGPRAALRVRWRYYTTLAVATVGLALVFTLPVVFRGVDSGAGFKLEAFGPLEYARTQPGVILHYLRLVFWPYPQCFDYDWPIAKSPSEYVPQTAAIAVLLGATLVLLVRRSWIGFAGACFFVLLAPSSSFVPILDPAFEHRMYLPLAAVLVLVVTGAWWLGARFLPRARALRPVLATTLALALATLTVRRNEDYRTAERLWRLTLGGAPQNARAHGNLGSALLEAGRIEEAIRELTTGMGLDPGLGLIQQNLGAAYWQLGKPERAIYFLERGLRLKETPLGLGSLGFALLKTGDFAGAVFYLRKAVELTPDDPHIRFQLANALGMLQRSDEALQQYEEALRLDPGFQDARINLAAVLAEMGRPDEALEHLRISLEILPNSGQEYLDLGHALRALERLDEALAAFQEASRLAPEKPEPLAAFAATVCAKTSASQDERQEALRLATKAIEMTDSKQAESLEIGAEVHAALGEFERAVVLLDTALALSDTAANPTLQARLHARREDYGQRAGR